MIRQITKRPWTNSNCFQTPCRCLNKTISKDMLTTFWTTEVRNYLQAPSHDVCSLARTLSKAVQSFGTRRYGELHHYPLGLSLFGLLGTSGPPAAIGVIGAAPASSTSALNELQKSVPENITKALLISISCCSRLS